MQALAALANGLEEQRRGRRGDVQRVDLAAPGQRRRGRRRRWPPAAGGPCPRRRGRARSGRSGRRPRARDLASASAPQIQKPAALASASQSARLRTWAICEVLDGAGRGLAGDGGDRGRAPLGDDDARPRRRTRPSGRRRRGCAGPGPGRGRRAARPRRAAAPRGSRVGIGIDLGDDALVVGRAAEPLQLLGGRSPAPARPGAPAASPAPPRRPAASRR